MDLWPGPVALMLRGRVLISRHLLWWPVQPNDSAKIKKRQKGSKDAKSFPAGRGTLISGNTSFAIFDRFLTVLSWKGLQSHFR